MSRTPRALYNEIDNYAADWLEALISRGLIADGDVARCSIVDLRPSDLAGYNQVHLFAGIGVWSYGLRRAGIPDSANVWTGSCPCQPFSAAGKGGGFADERHLWPAFHHLISQCKPDIVLGEQVASKDGLAWLDLVLADMENENYAIGPHDSCSAGFGAPHIRQRLRFAAFRMAYSTEPGWESRRRIAATSDGRDASWLEPGRLCDARAVGDTVPERLQERIGDGGIPGGTLGARTGQAAIGAGVHVDQLGHTLVEQQSSLGTLSEGARTELDRGCDSVVVADSDRIQGRLSEYPGWSPSIEIVGRGEVERPDPTNGFWDSCDWLYCRDGKWRPVEPGTFPLAHGASSRVGRLRAYGNAVDAEATTEFCAAVRAALPGIDA
jgi:DNA (cytosine-5)-methyltransferase 1